MNEKLELTKMNGMNVSGDVICYLEDTISSRRFIYYTLNEIVGEDASQTIKIYVGKIAQNPGLDAPITEEEWTKLKGIMGEVLKGETNDTIKYIPLSEITTPSIVDEKVIAMPTSYDYVNKHHAVYVEAAGESGEANVIAPVEETPIAEDAVAPTIEASLESNMFESGPIEIPIEPSMEPIAEPATEPVVETNEDIVLDSNPTPDVESVVTNEEDLEPIDIATIETKYNEMIEDINRLKEKEIEAAKRFNATLELNAMHNEQHASYVQNEQLKEEPTVEGTPAIEENNQIVEEPTMEMNPVVEENSETPVVEETPIEPTPVEPTSFDAAALETNWFDMPIQG